jgi:hypothetical protein
MFGTSIYNKNSAKDPFKKENVQFGTLDIFRMKNCLFL